VLGDARISLERELKQPKKERPQGSNGFDVLALDAFNGDAIPVHLLTRESFALYWRHLRPDGILALNISNLHLDLAPVVAGLAREAGKKMVMISNDEDTEQDAYATDWALVTSNETFLNDPKVKAAINEDGAPEREIVWTDQYSNIVQILRPFQWPKNGAEADGAVEEQGNGSDQGSAEDED
jgi:spermidine synthase